ncbi:MAG: response regulator [Hyphomicrobiaceae bacterium]
MHDAPHEKHPVGRILIVDDDPVFTAMAAACLSGAKFAPTIANDGVTALELLEAGTYHAALIDLAMPRVDGFRLIGFIRSMARHARMAIVVISSRTDVHAFEESYALGANGFQTKPVNWALLPTQLRYILRETGSLVLPADIPAPPVDKRDRRD